MILVLLSFLIQGFFCFAGTYVGIQGGVNVSTPTYEPEIATEALIKPTYGLGIDFDLSDVFSIGAELSYLEKGGTYFSLNTDFVDQYKMLESSVILKIRPFSWFIRPLVEVGVSYAAVLDAQQKQFRYPSGSLIRETEIENAAKTEYSAQVGAGIEWIVVKEKMRLALSGRYEKGLSRVLIEPHGGSIFGKTQFINYIFLLSTRFNLSSGEQPARL